MAAAPIRVLLVDDSPVALTILRRMLSASPDILVVGMARSGREALALIPHLQPAVICTDLHMPNMDGLALTRAVMARFPRPILVVSVSVQNDDTQNIFELLEAGAIDVCPKPRAGLESEEARVAQELVSKIKILSGVVPFTKMHRASVELKAPGKSRLLIHERPVPRVVAFGASTGGPQALQTILTQLPAGFPVPILCVQHISEGFLQGLVDWLAMQCALRVKIMQAYEIPRPGTVYFPQEGTHLELDSLGRMAVSLAPPVAGHRPSVTVTFQSVARHFGRAMLGVLLTGMGSDGAAGMQAIAQVGGITIAQDEATSVVFGMPQQAIALGAADHVLPLGEIGPLLMKLCRVAKREVQ